MIVVRLHTCTVNASLVPGHERAAEFDIVFFFFFTASCRQLGVELFIIADDTTGALTGYRASTGPERLEKVQ